MRDERLFEADQSCFLDHHHGISLSLAWSIQDPFAHTHLCPTSTFTQPSEISISISISFTSPIHLTTVQVQESIAPRIGICPAKSPT